MHKIERCRGEIKIVAAMLDIVALAYFGAYLYLILSDFDTDTHPLTSLFAHINPMSIGTYCLGIVMLIHLLVFKNLLGRFLVSIPYIFLVVVSLIASVEMTGGDDLMMFVPHAAIIGVAAAIVIRQVAKNDEKQKAENPQKEFSCENT